MSVQAVTGQDTLQINDRVLTDLADGDVTSISFPNEIVSVKTGKNNNTIYAKNETGKNADLIIRVVRGSADDKFLLNLKIQQDHNFASFVLLSGSLFKQVGDGLGNVTSDLYPLSGGVFSKNIDVKDNVEGDTEQAVAVYNIRLALAERSLT